MREAIRLNQEVGHERKSDTTNWKSIKEKKDKLFLIDLLSKSVRKLVSKPKS